jgi:GTPase SAR1 family protein
VLSYPHGAVSGFRTFQEVIKHNDFPAVKKMEECMDAFVRADVGSMSWKIIDVGGQRSERRKWAAYLDNVDLVFFMLNANGYKSPLYEDNSLRKSDESIALFENTFKTSFLNHPIYVMLTKTDLFHEEFDAKMFASAYPGWLPPVEVNDTKSLAEATDKSMSVSKNALQYLEVYVRSKCPKVSRVSVASVSMFDQNRLFDVFQECKDEVIYGRYDKMWEYLDAHQQDRNLRMTARRGKKGAAGKYKVAPGPAGGHASGAEGSQTRSALRSGTMSPSSKSGALISGYEECGVGFVNKNYLAAALRKRG